MKEFFSMLYESCEPGYIEIRTKGPSGWTQKYYPTTMADDILDEIVTEQKTFKSDKFFGVGLRDGLGGKKENVCCIPAVWCDVDYKGSESALDLDITSTIEKLKSFCMPPTAIITSGGGVHAYWVFKEAACNADINTIESINRGLCKLFDGDYNAIDGARILRVPGSKNYKYIPSRKCSVVEFNDNRYLIEDFEDYKEEDSPTKHIEVDCTCNIEEGSRNSAITHMVGTWVAEGETGEGLMAKAIGFNMMKCKPPLPEREVRAIVASILVTHEKKYGKTGTCEIVRKPMSELSFSQKVKDYILDGSGKVSIEQVYRYFNVTGPSDKATIRQAFRRLCTEGLVDKDPNQRGLYRVVDRELTPINFMDVDDVSLDVWLPFDLHRYVDVMPKNIIVFAGETNLGKTALMVHMALKNIEMGLKDFSSLRYFSSEMGSREMHKRARRFGLDRPEWKDFNMYECDDNIADKIDPNGINFIDYMEVNEEFYLVGRKMRDVHDALNDGIAVVALQKKHGCIDGVGGAKGMEKPRLYITLSFQDGIPVMRVTKAKNIKEENINNWSVPYEMLEAGKIINTLAPFRYRSIADDMKIRSEIVNPHKGQLTLVQ